MAEQPKYVTTADGRRITYTRWKYEETQRQQATLAQVNDLITSQATTLANVGANMAQQEYGGYLRTIIPNLLDSYGNVNAQAAINYYEQSRKEWFNAYGSEASRQVTRSSVAAREKRFAAAKTQGAYRVGTMTAEDFAAKFLPTYKTLEKSEAVIGFAMKVRAKSGHEPSVSAMNNALTREVASYHRDTVLFNSALDPFVSRVQRVAQAGACEFCKLMALGSTSGKVRVSSYAVKFHSHCHCTIQTLWEGEDPIRPDYYDDFEQEYIDAAGEGRSAKETLEQWRKNTKAKVTTPTVTAPVENMAPAPVIKTAEEFAIQSKNVSAWELPVTSDIPDQYWWQKLDGKTGIKLFDIRQAGQIPLDNSGVSIPKLAKIDSIENAAKGANPNYAAGGNYTTNCARVVQSYELRRRGYDVSANANTNDFLQSMRTYLSGWRDPKTGVTAYESTVRVANTRKAIEVIQSYPEGARGAIAFDYPGRAAAGHTLNWEVKDGKVLYVDAQPGNVGAAAVKPFAGLKLKNVAVTRLDNLEPTAHTLGYIEGFGK